MWIRTLIVAFGLALGIGLCAYVARQFTKIGGKGAVGTAFRWGLFPLAVFLLTFRFSRCTGSSEPLRA